MNKQYIIIVAGGSGRRMNSIVPKQFIEIDGQAMIIKTLRRFLNYNVFMQIIISVHPDHKKYLEALIENSDLASTSIQITDGGATRFDSVKNGLKLLDDMSSVVGIHDAARPFVSLQTIKSCFETASLKGNAIPCITVNESLRKINGDLNESVNRDEFRVIQTPQCFLISEIKKAYEQDNDPRFTDDAMVLESIGTRINLVEGNIENIKITSPYDLQIAKSFFENE